MQNKKLINIHKVFADYFHDPVLKIIANKISQKLEEGNICVSVEELDSAGKHNIDISKLNSNPLITDDAFENPQPFVLNNNNLYLHRYFIYESIIINKINTLITTGNEKLKENLKVIKNQKELISKICYGKSNNSVDNNPWPLISILNSLIHDFTIITGGPGTGKTTTIAKLIAIYLQLYPDTSIAMAAPTGKAAAKIKESVLNMFAEIENASENTISETKNLNFSTIHRLLGVNFNKPGFWHNKDNPLKHDLIIVDESSMIDVILMAKLMDALKPGVKLILVGDKNQLTSVEAGSIFGDLCKVDNSTNIIDSEMNQIYELFDINDKEKLLKIPVKTNILTGKITELIFNYRFKDSEEIQRISNVLLIDKITKEDLIVPFKTTSKNNKQVTISDDHNNLEFAEMLKNYEIYAKENDISKALENLNKTIILCALNDGEYGYKENNIKVEKYLKSRGLINPDSEFYHKQPVMTTSNDYSLGLYNGDTGIVWKDLSTGQIYIYFKNTDGDQKRYPLSSIKSYQTAYSITIHKSQGTEYENVVIIIPDDENSLLLSRELLYTAITRARKKVLIIGKEDIILKSANRRIKRMSGIKKRIENIN